MKRSIKKKRYSNKRYSKKRYSKRKSVKQKYSRKLNIKNKSKKKYSRKKRRNSKKVIVGGVSTVDDVEADGSYDELMDNFEKSVQLLQESEEQLKIANGNNEALQVVLQESEEQLEIANGDNEALQNKNVELVKQIKEQEKKIIDCGASEQNYNQRETELQNLETINTELQNDLDAVKEVLKKKQQELKDSLANVREGPIETTSCDNTEIQNELDLTRQLLEENEQKRVKLQEELNDQKKIVNGIIGEKEKAEAAKTDALKSKNAMGIQLDAANGELQKKEDELKSKIKELTKATENIENQEKEIIDLTQQLEIAKTNKTNDEFENFKEEIIKIINSPSSNFRSFDKLNQQFTEGADKLQAETTSLLDEINEAENP